jgi:meso-butanediol dehydrogenase / (S,S)-butanediol dehydrogenase / diacetyl reductase
LTGEPEGRLAGRVAFISGASRGIGRAIALAFAAEGAELYLASTNGHLLSRLADEIGAKARFEVLDVSDTRACASAGSHAIDAFGRVDILVNSASIYVAKRFLEYSIADFQRTLQVNLFGTIALSQALLAPMIDRKFGRIINIASTAGRWAARASAYSMSKHAVVGLTKCLALEAGPQGVTVNAICPGSVETDMLESLMEQLAEIDATTTQLVRERMLSGPAMKRFLAPEEVASLAVYLASSEAGGMTGQCLSLDGGLLFI